MSVIHGRVIARAYRDTGALEAECSSCGAPAGQYCTRRDDLSGDTYRRRIPCLARIPATCKASAADDETHLAIDFSEPRHG